VVGFEEVILDAMRQSKLIDRAVARLMEDKHNLQRQQA
jgi:hypothetical protein